MSLEERCGAAQSVERETLQVVSGTRHWRGQLNFKVLSSQPDGTSISEGATIGIFLIMKKYPTLICPLFSEPLGSFFLVWSRFYQIRLLDRLRQWLMINGLFYYSYH